MNVNNMNVGKDEACGCRNRLNLGVNNTDSIVTLEKCAKHAGDEK